MSQGEGKYLSQGRAIYVPKESEYMSQKIHVPASFEFFFSKYLKNSKFAAGIWDENTLNKDNISIGDIMICIYLIL